MVLAQDAFPGSPVYHYGWYNAIIVALFVIAAMQKKRNSLAAFGCAIVVFAGVASGLMAPDTHAVVGAPGATVTDGDLGGSFVFPLQGNEIMLQRGRSSVAISDGRRYTGGFVLWEEPRTVVYVTADDLRGNHLTITQPTNASFLSPVLLMQQSTDINGMHVPFDTFSVPAANRNVRALLFDKQQTALLQNDPQIQGRNAVLFDVTDQAGREVAAGLGFAPDGGSAKVGGLVLRAHVSTYPAVVAAAAPYWPVLLLGVAIFAAAAVRSVAAGSDSRTTREIT